MAKDCYSSGVSENYRNVDVAGLFFKVIDCTRFVQYYFFNIVRIFKMTYNEKGCSITAHGGFLCRI